MLSRKFPLPTHCSGSLQSPTTLTHGTDGVCVVVQLYPWLKFYFPLFWGMVYTIMILNNGKFEIKIRPRIKLNHNIAITGVNCIWHGFTHKSDKYLKVPCSNVWSIIILKSSKHSGAAIFVRDVWGGDGVRVTFTSDGIVTSFVEVISGPKEIPLVLHLYRIIITGFAVI